jgi:hypothetical protein
VGEPDSGPTGGSPVFGGEPASRGFPSELTTPLALTYDRRAQLFYSRCDAGSYRGFVVAIRSVRSHVRLLIGPQSRRNHVETASRCTDVDSCYQ